MKLMGSATLFQFSRFVLLQRRDFLIVSFKVFHLFIRGVQVVPDRGGEGAKRPVLAYI